MEQHAIPQQISSYQFRLVGDMTLKQFFQVGGGALIAILVYTSGLPVYIKWPLIVVSFILGVALAFFPLEDRPLSKWIVLFAKSIYAPTLYVWMKNYQKPQYFQTETAQTLNAASVPLPVAAETTQPAVLPEIEKKEEQFLTNVDQQLGTIQGASGSVEVVSSAPIHIEEQVAHEVEPAASRPEVHTPEVAPVVIEQSEKPAEVAVVAAPVVSEDYTVTPVTGQQSQNTSLAQFSPDAAPPMPPTRENVIVGQVMKNDGAIVENAILEIKDEEGRPVRALKSNKLGHFMIVTPLLNGKYEIATEKDGLVFDTVTVNAEGVIVPPIAIRAKAT